MSKVSMICGAWNTQTTSRDTAVYLLKVRPYKDKWRNSWVQVLPCISNTGPGITSNGCDKNISQVLCFRHATGKGAGVIVCTQFRELFWSKFALRQLRFGVQDETTRPSSSWQTTRNRWRHLHWVSSVERVVLLNDLSISSIRPKRDQVPPGGRLATKPKKFLRSGYLDPSHRVLINSDRKGKLQLNQRLINGDFYKIWVDNLSWWAVQNEN